MFDYSMYIVYKKYKCLSNRIYKVKILLIWNKNIYCEMCSIVID